MENNLDRLKIERKTGDEYFRANGKLIKKKLVTFWQWSSSDLASNVTRGILAEFIVAVALGIDDKTVREEWSPYDLETEDGIRIEVKSSSYLQSWSQTRMSSISFGIPKTRWWDPETNAYRMEPERCSDVYVFALLSHKDKSTLDPMNLNQWQFFVVPTIKIDRMSINRKSISLSTLKDISENAIKFQDLKKSIEIAYRYQKEN